MEGILKQVIRSGAPLYNAGRQGDCYALYKNCADSIANGSENIESTSVQRDLLREAVEDAAQQSNVSSAAWTLRRAFDAILGGYGAQGGNRPCGQDDNFEDKECVVLDCNQDLPATPRFFSLDDGVMGGISSSNWSWDDNEAAAVFSGEVRTERNGGFASIRSQPWDGWQSRRARGLSLLSKGDGRTYKISLKTDDNYYGISYQLDFPTTEGSWQVVEAPFAAFKPSLRGRFIEGQPPLRGAYIRQLGLMVSKFSDAGGLVAGFHPGRFRLALKHIKYVL